MIECVSLNQRQLLKLLYRVGELNLGLQIKQNVLHLRPPASISCGTGRKVFRRRVAECVSLRGRRLQPAHREGGWPQVGAGKNWSY